MVNRKTRRTLRRLLTAVPGLYTVIAFVCARRVTIRGWSMYPAVRPGEAALFDRLAYVRSRPRRGDIVLAKHPARPGLRLVKRVAGAPGDAVPRGRDGPPGRLYAPDSPTLGRGEYWLLGDNADLSTDSRQLGVFRREDILARGWLVYWPPERFRALNRNRSSCPCPPQEGA